MMASRECVLDMAPNRAAPCLANLQEIPAGSRSLQFSVLVDIPHMEVDVLARHIEQIGDLCLVRQTVSLSIRTSS